MTSTSTRLMTVPQYSKFDLEQRPEAWSFLQRILNSHAAKRVLDITISGIGLLLLSPVFLLVALFIKLTDGGPVLFIQSRIGKGGRPFSFFKLRSMVVEAHRLKITLQDYNVHGTDGITFKLKNDPRVTWIGMILRCTSIDELPQLWNVLRGDMSLVGPRPGLPEEVARYSPQERRRLEVLPGITCLWQVQGRSHLPFPEQVRLDLEYVHERTLWLDLTLMVKTIPAVLSCRGAY